MRLSKIIKNKKLREKVLKLSSIYFSRASRNEKRARTLIERSYKLAMGKPLNLDNPQLFTEKVQWSKLYDRNPLKTICADKYAVRNFVTERIGEDHLIPLLGVWKRVDEIDFNSLPEQFVLKCNHGCGMNIIVKNKRELNIEKARKTLNGWLKMNIGYTPGLELHYADIPPCIIAEKYVEISGGRGLPDYKIFCFDGIPKYIWYISGRETTPRSAIYDTLWKLTPYNMTYPPFTETIPKPDNLDQLLSAAQTLAAGFSFVRVDLYTVDGRIYFGEMTFTPTGGIMTFSPPEYDEILGKLWELPNS